MYRHRRSHSETAKQRSLGGRKVPTRKGAPCVFKSLTWGGIHCHIAGKAPHGLLKVRVSKGKGSYLPGDVFNADPHRIYPPRRKTIANRSR